MVVMKGPRLKKAICFAAGGRWGIRLLPVILIGIFVELRAPAALAFPYHRRIGETVIYADQPIDSNIYHVVKRADRLLQASPISTPNIHRQIVLTDGGWRWKVLALNLSGAVAFRRPFSNALILNRSDVARDVVSNGAPLGGRRTLSGTIAHETVHMLVAHHLGELRAMRLPAWKQEGYADYIAGETSLDPRDEDRIRAIDPHARVLTYYQGRRRVAAELRRNGGSVEALMAP